MHFRLQDAHPHINGLIREPDEGIFDAWNRVLALAESDVIGLINADDFLMPGALNRVTVELLHAAKMTTRRYLRPLLGLN